MARVGHWLALGLVLAAVGSAGFVYLRWLYREQRYNQLIEQIAPQYGVDRFLVKAVMRRESNFDPFAYSSKGAIGLMQVTPSTGQDWARATHHADFRRDSLWDPRTNLEAGTWYLSRSLRRWRRMDDPLPFVLAEYNAGPAPVQRWFAHAASADAAGFTAAIDYGGVRRYVTSVKEYYAHYQRRGRL